MNTAPLIALVSVIGLFITIASLLGIRAAWRIGKTAQTVTNYRDAASSWEATSNALKSELAELKARNVQVTQQLETKLQEATTIVNQLKTKVQVLEDLATGRTALSEMTAAFTAQIQNLSEHVAGKERVDLVERSLRSAIEDLRDEIRALAGKGRP